MPVSQWLKWNFSGRKVPFQSPLLREIEFDTTTACTGLPGCREVCTYAHTRQAAPLFMTPEFAERTLTDIHRVGFRSILFSGGGEPLTPENVHFSEILQTAERIGFENHLVTNGVFLGAERIPEILPFLRLLRLSVPPATAGYDHLAVIGPTIARVLGFRQEQQLKMEVSISVLVNPDTPFSAIDRVIETAEKIGVDKIRFKPVHERKDGGQFIDIKKFGPLVAFLQQKQNPRVTISKIDWLQTRPDVAYEFCYYADFNSFNIGADGRVYSCCEQKYRPDFLRGDLNQKSASAVLEDLHKNPFRVREDCFAGCKGDIANILLASLVQSFDDFGNPFFEMAFFAKTCEQLLTYLSRSNPRA